MAADGEAGDGDVGGWDAELRGGGGLVDVVVRRGGRRAEGRGSWWGGMGAEGECGVAERREKRSVCLWRGSVAE